jgi:hypothetical protein
MRVAVVIKLTEVERATLESYARGRSTPARLVLRAKIVFRSATGMENKDIAEELTTLAKTALPADDRSGDAGWPGDPSDRRQLRHAQARQGEDMARAPPALPHALHADQFVVAQYAFRLTH